MSRYAATSNTKKRAAKETLKLLDCESRAVSNTQAFFADELYQLVEIHCPDHDPDDMTVVEMRHALCEQLVDGYDGHFIGARSNARFRAHEVVAIYEATNATIHNA